MMMSPFKIILKPNLQYIPDFENPKNQKGHVISDSFLTIYQLDDMGCIKKLQDYKGIPSDENYLNEFLAESNDLFIELMEIEDKC